ncbi:MAG: DUF554 domain-containing protein [Bacteroidaceae bacterium]|nr:DUF554 domain-containing protein [Bacteroidaceae bacterium]
MLGTIVNTSTIILGSLIGATLKRGIKPQYQEVVFIALGVCSIALGLNAFVRFMPSSHYPVLFILSMAIGGVVGAMLRLSERFNRLVDRKRKADDDSPRLSEGLSTAILLFCIGTFSMLGPVNSALLDDNTYLYTNATLDFVTSMVLSATYGYGIMLAAPVLFCWQGMFYLTAKISASAISDDLITELSIVGGLLIMASGITILKLKDCKTLNLLPALFVPILFFLFRGLFLQILTHFIIK